MMRWTIVLILVGAAIWSSSANSAPLTAKDIALMLRSGYTSETVLRDLSVRKFADKFDSETEKQLLHAGASSSLIDALRSGAYQMSASEISAAKTKSSVASETRSEIVPPSASPSPPVASTPPPDSMYLHLKDDLVYLHQGSVIHFDDEVLEQKKFYLLFFSANWSIPGRKFTSQLVDYYNRIESEHPEFEIIFFSADHSQFGMETYMTQTSMPWPALAYEKREGKAGQLQNNLGHEIPSLVLADASGKILSRSHTGDTSVSMEQVLAETDQVLTHKAP